MKKQCRNWGQPFDPLGFPYQFLAAFGNKETTIKRLRAAGSFNASHVPGGILQRGNIYLAICAAGEVDATLKALRDSPKTASAKAKFILATDDERYRRKTSPSDDPPIACEHAAPPFLILRGVDAKERIGQIQRQYEFSTK